MLRMHEKQWVAFTSLLAAVFLTSTKLGVGLWTNSLGILSEAAHSGLDLIAAGITFWAIRISDKPADRRHTYGHGKIENLSALAETFLLLITCAWIIFEGMRRLIKGGVEVDPNIWAFLIVIVSIIIDFSRSRALKKAAKKYNSQALEADALHFSTDIWSSLVVLLGLSLVRLGDIYKIPWLSQMDAVAALGVAGIVIWVGVRLARRSLSDLIDAAPFEISYQIAQAAKLSGVVDVRQVRARKSGPNIFADIIVLVDNTLSFEKAHDLANRIESNVRKTVPRTDVVVHTEPVEVVTHDLPSFVRSLAARFEMGVHNIRFSDQPKHKILELHLEVKPSKSVYEAHSLATQFEQELRQRRPEITEVISHIEPLLDTDSAKTAQSGFIKIVRSLIDEFFKEHLISGAPHDLSVRQLGRELVISLHLAVPGESSIVDAHHITARLEQYLREKLPHLDHVTIHIEPIEEEDH